MSLIKPDIVLFVGDISDGNIRIIKKINLINIPTFVILGNHDRGKDSSGETLLKQIRVLQEKYCAWDLKIFNNQLNILSARPCSSGGGYFLSTEVKAVYGPISEQESVNKILKCSEKIVKDLPLIFMSHAGPSGLGSDSSSICGKDWKEPACDWGDRDLAVAISKIQKKRKIDLVIFGHMHNHLKRNKGFRKMFEIDKKGTAYLNSAIVPRYKKNEKGELAVNFSWVEFRGTKLTHISHRWYSELGEILEEEILF
ncbi:putative transcripton factor [Prochlorococcus marinus str. MIT 9515]|uniref:Putative transcripton factor n=1 Tax=Prochlorococcus marinus (strain MIT 9515) TaxID=167542 RepID=A2BW00_PROM5|nr:putative transcripton factor [Prochlorococcus marinus str. MIT 9515]